MLGVLKSLFGRPRKAATVMVWLSYADRGREGLEAHVELHGANVEGFPWSWARNSVRSPGAGVSPGQVDLDGTWVDRFNSHGFAPGSRNGEPVVVAREGVGSWASGSLLGQHPGAILMTLPDEVFDKVASLGRLVQEATLIEPRVSFVIRLEEASASPRRDDGDDEEILHTSSDPEPFSLTEEENAAVGRLVALGYVLGTEGNARAEAPEDRPREETGAAEVPPPSGMWATLPAVEAVQEASQAGAPAPDAHHVASEETVPAIQPDPMGSDWEPSGGAYGR